MLFILPILVLLFLFVLSRFFTGKVAASISAVVVLLVWHVFPEAQSAHWCHEGQPPTLFFFSFAVFSAFLTFKYFKRFALIAVPCLGIYVFSTIIGGQLASAYHSNNYTGNPVLASGSYWHTFFTGLRPRKEPLPKSMDSAAE